MFGGLAEDLPLEALEAALHRLGVRIREEAMADELASAGGLCVIHGQRTVLLAAGAPPWRKAEVLLEALRRLDTEDIWLPPAIRRRL